MAVDREAVAEVKQVLAGYPSSALFRMALWAISALEAEVERLTRELANMKKESA